MESLKLNRSDYRVIGGYLLVLTFFLILKFRVEDYTLLEYFVDIPVVLVQNLILLFVAKWLIENFVIKKRNYLLLLLLAVFSLWFISFLSMLSGNLTRDGFIRWDELPPLGELIIYNINNSVFNLCIPLSLIAAKKYYEYQLNHVKLASAQKELELRMLRSQFDPHFLYNNLNTIDALIDYSPKEKVKAYISNLAALYRHLAKIKDEEIVSLEDEIELARNYIFLIETRFSSDYKVEFLFASIPERKFLPSGALLSILENIVKHNQAAEGRNIRIEIKLLEESVFITNSKSQLAHIQTDSLGSGLKNLEKRYELLSEKQILVEDTEDAFSVYLPLLEVIN